MYMIKFMYGAVLTNMIVYQGMAICNCLHVFVHNFSEKPIRVVDSKWMQTCLIFCMKHLFNCCYQTSKK